MTSNNFEYFQKLPGGAEHLAEAEANAGDVPPPDPATIDFDPVETEAGWTFQGADRVWRGREEARAMGQRARANAGRAYANHVNALPEPQLTPGQIALATHREALAAFIEDGGTEAQAAAWPHLLDRYQPRSGYEEYQQHKQNR